jgi:hypothetical protein
MRLYLDSYLSNELLVETNHEVLRHLEKCAECSKLLEEKTRIRNMLRTAVRNQVAPTSLESRIRAGARAQRAWGIPVWALAVAAAAVFTVGMGVFVMRETASGHVADLLRVGLRDHVHCALGGHYPAVPPTVGEMTQKLGSEFAGIVPIVQASFPGYQILEGHRCTADKRRYVHMILRRDAAFLSVIVTDKRPGEVFPRNLLLPTLQASGVVLREATIDQLEVTGFETRDHLAYVVSNLGRAESVQVAQQWAPPLRDLLAKLEI